MQPPPLGRAPLRGATKTSLLQCGSTAPQAGHRVSGARPNAWRGLSVGRQALIRGRELPPAMGGFASRTGGQRKTRPAEGGRVSDLSPWSGGAFSLP
ncbi:hypothetical protein TRIHO_18400 [Tritonibacter horizontis]|uniref:Uncharacterized protein n=1 Tax=Tritonibacter horizontis TaxID=1768241 RepID=A0A132BY73_9RHOB|nr:hypothetical protein TRIHO_18400 [Tritonibacter horizontis]